MAPGDDRCRRLATTTSTTATTATTGSDRRRHPHLRAQANQVFATGLDTAIEQHAMATLAGGGRHEKYKAVAAAPAFAEPSAAARPLKSARGRWGDALAKVR